MQQIVITVNDDNSVGIETDKNLKHYEILGYIEMAKNGIEFQAMNEK